MSARASQGRFFRASRERLELLRELRREEGLESADAPSIPRRPDPSVHPLSFSQERLWFLDRLDPDNPAYTIPSSLRLRGRLDVPALARALTEVARRHETLRATFHEAGGQPVQRVAPPPWSQSRCWWSTSAPSRPRAARRRPAASPGARRRGRSISRRGRSSAPGCCAWPATSTR